MEYCVYLMRGKALSETFFPSYFLASSFSNYHPIEVARLALEDMDLSSWMFQTAV